MLDGATLVLVEVRYRSMRDFGGPAASVTWRKQRRIISAARHLLLTRAELRRYPARFDVVGISPASTGSRSSGSRMRLRRSRIRRRAAKDRKKAINRTRGSSCSPSGATPRGANATTADWLHDARSVFCAVSRGSSNPMLETTAEVACPHCGETITLFLDLSIESQTYIEDCSVCCQPMSVSYTVENGELADLRVESRHSLTDAVRAAHRGPVVAGGLQPVAFRACGAASGF